MVERILGCCAALLFLLEPSGCAPKRSLYMTPGKPASKPLAEQGTAASGVPPQNRPRPAKAQPSKAGAGRLAESPAAA